MDCRRMVEEEGYRAVKTKVGGDSGVEDLGRVEAVRDALGPGIRIMADASGRWSFPQAIQLDSPLADFDIPWFKDWMKNPAQVEDGFFINSQVAGVGM